MCGIVAISTSKNQIFPVEQSIRTIKHRGPDDEGIYRSTDYDAQLGHVRLSIIDLSAAGHQPMEDNSGRFVISYNGEIYNFHILKKYLELVYGEINWRSNSDTEVILEGFAREGTDFLSKLNGIFAFVIYDKEKRNLHVLRDPIGVKPLYYTNQDKSFYFCSELKGLLIFKHLHATIRTQSLADQLLFMYVPEPYTMYEEFFKIEPGFHYLYNEGKFIQKKYLFEHLKSPVYFSSALELIDRLRDTFSASVKRQLISDVPVSLLLSGGLDSSSIASEAIKGGANIKSAYTISFSREDSKYDGQSDDLYYAKMLAKQLNINLEIIQAQPDFLSILPSLIDFLEDGISDPAAINTFLICERARANGVKVMLSGQGADEYLCGYRRYPAEQIIQNMSFPVRKILATAGNLIPDSVPGPLNAVTRRFKRMAVSAGLEVNHRLPRYFMWTTPEIIKDLFLERTSINPGYQLQNFFTEHIHQNDLETMLLADQQFDLLSLNLTYNDKMSMKAGVEARVPFLDLEMVQLMNSLPLSMKLKRNEKKFILKKAMESSLPKEIIYRQKAGFSLPIRAWFRQRDQIIDKYFDPVRLKNQGIFHSEGIQNMLKDTSSGRSDHSYILFSMLCQQMWLEKQFGY